MERNMIWVLGSGILLGILLNIRIIALKPAITYFFAFITFSVSLNSSFKDFKTVLKMPFDLCSILGLLHIILPLYSLVIAKLLLPGQPLLQAGVVLITATPIGVASVLWTNIAKGNVPLSLTAVMIDTFMSPFVVPAVIFATMGRDIQFDVMQIIIGMLWMVVLPTLAGIGLHDLTKGYAGRAWGFVTGPTSKILLSLVLAINVAAAWDSLQLVKSSMVMLMFIVMVMGSSGYLIGYFYSRLFKRPAAITSSYIFTVGMRNNTAGLVLALSYFNHLTAVPVVCAIFLQQFLAATSLRYLVIKE